MKLLKTLLASALAITIVGLSSAQATGPTIIRLIGSTAYRGAVENAIHHTIGSNLTFAWYTDPATGFSTEDKAQAVIYSGTISAAGGNNVAGATFLPVGTSVIIKAFWGGSVGGAKALVKAETPTSDSQNWWLDESANSLTAAGNRLTSPVFNDTSVAPDAAFTDGAPSTIQAYLAAHNVAWSVTGFSEALVGVNTFVFVKGFPSAGNTPVGTFSNITALQYRSVQSPTLTFLYQITGNAADSANVILPFGRDEDSGTRITTLAETALGTTTLLNQFQPTFNYGSSSVTSISKGNVGSGYTAASVTINAVAGDPGTGATATATVSGGTVTGYTVTNPGSNYHTAPQVVVSGDGSGATANANIAGATITDVVKWPANQVAQINYPQGDSGFVNGPDLAFALNQTPAASGDSGGLFPAMFVGYLSVGDAAGVNGGNNALTYNGTACTSNNIIQGQYSFWSYEHMLWSTSNTNKNYFIGIAQQLYVKESIGGTANVNGASVNKTLRVQDLAVSRGVEGSVITNGNTASQTTVAIVNH